MAKFEKGNPGKPKGSKCKLKSIENELVDALKKAKIEHGKSFLEHFIERAFKRDIVGIALAKKILPDKTDLSSSEGLEFKVIVGSQGKISVDKL